MSWATLAIEALRRGDAVEIRPRGHSMKGRVDDRDVVRVEPCDPATLVIGDIVLVRVRGTDYLHLVKAVDAARFLIGNNRGRLNGWVGANAIYGVATVVASVVSCGTSSMKIAPSTPIRFAIAPTEPITMLITPTAVRIPGRSGVVGVRY